MLDEVEDALELRMQASGIELRVPRPLPTVHCHSTFIAEVLRNLINNAIEFNDKDARWIEIGHTADASPTNQVFTFYVRDNGIGIRKKCLETVFQLFKRLHSRNKFTDVPRPSVILLDLNLPGTDGRELLAEIKNDNVLKHIPVIVLTTSTDERDVEACYRAGANSYMQKPVDLPGFVEAIARLKDFWLEIAVLPQGNQT